MATALFTGVTANGATAAVTLPGVLKDFTVLAYGTWGGGTLTIEISHDNSNWVSAGSNSILTANGGTNIHLAAASPIYVRGNLAGSTGANLSAVIL